MQINVVLLMLIFIAVLISISFKIGVSCLSFFQTLKFLALWVGALFYCRYFDLKKTFTLPILFGAFVLCFFPLLNDYAIQFSTKSFHNSNLFSYLAEQTYEFEAKEITVWWGTIWAKIIYTLIAISVGVYVQKVFYPEYRF